MVVAVCSIIMTFVDKFNLAI